MSNLHGDANADAGAAVTKIMNISNWSDKRKVLALFAMIFIVIGIVVTIYLVQRVQETRSRAALSTTLSLAPPTQTVAPGQDATFDINIDPGQNEVSAIKITIKFDPAKFSATAQSFALEETSNLSILEGPVVGNGTVAVSMGIGGQTSVNAIKTPTKIGVLKLKALTDAPIGETQVSFEREDATIVNSVAGTDNPSENVLSNAVPATVNIAAECKPSIATCSWDPVEGATSYHYVITNVTENEVFSEGNTSDTSIEFSSGVGIEYKCEVTATNECGGTGEAGVDSQTCANPSESPTPTPTGVVSNTPTPTVTNTPTPTPTGVISITPSITRTNSPTPTSVISTATPTIPQGGIESPTPTIPTDVTTTPTLPPTGNPLVIGGIIGGILILLGGLALLIL